MKSELILRLTKKAKYVDITHYLLFQMGLFYVNNSLEHV